MRTLKQKVDVELKDARVGWQLERVKNAHPSTKRVSKIRTLRQKVDVDLKDARVGWGVDGGQKCIPFVRKCVKNAYP